MKTNLKDIKTPKVTIHFAKFCYLFVFQYLCSNPLLKGSALLFNFFSPDKEFSNMFGPDKMGDIAGENLCCSLWIVNVSGLPHLSILLLT